MTVFEDILYHMLLIFCKLAAICYSLLYCKRGYCYLDSGLRLCL